jgi:DNA-binding HxlR family transcriptional regulator
MTGQPWLSDQDRRSVRVTDGSALDTALSRIGDRWALLVVHRLLRGPQRFGELQEAMPGIASNVLTQRLRRLESDGLVVAMAYSRRPPRFSYQLTSQGAELADALALLTRWGGGSESQPHDSCGTALEVRWYCPTCERVADPDGDGLEFV